MAELDLTELAPKRQSIKIEVERRGFFRKKKVLKEITYNNCDLETIAMFMREMGEYDRLQDKSITEEELGRIINQSAFLLWDTFYQDPKNDWLTLEDITNQSVKQIVAMLHHILKTISEEIDESAEDVKKK